MAWAFVIAISSPTPGRLKSGRPVVSSGIGRPKRGSDFRGLPEPLYLETWASHRDYPQENFLASDPIRTETIDPITRSARTISVAAPASGPSRTCSSGRDRYLEPRLGEGQNDRYPDVTDTFSPSEAPGLDARADFLRSDAFIEVDYREPRYPKRAAGIASTSRTTTIAPPASSRSTASMPTCASSSVFWPAVAIAARLFVSTSDTNAGQTMPFYFMPTLGGNDTLRGFREYRFRAPHAILAQGEYAGRSGAVSTPPSSTTPERSRTLVKISISRISNRTTALGSGSTPTAASSSVSMPRSEVVMASTCISSLAAFSRRAIARRAGPAQWVALAGFVGLLAAGTFVSLRSAAPRFYPDDPRWTDDDRAWTRRRPGRSKTRTATTSS